MVRFSIIISGRVQGVGYRQFCWEKALKMACTGWVKNLPDGRVQAEVQGESVDTLKLLSLLRDGPPMSYVIDIVKYEIPLEESETRFVIRY